MFYNERVEFNSTSTVPNYLNRNIANSPQMYEHNTTGNEAELEIVNINSPKCIEQPDSDEHEFALNEAWHCINGARCFNCNPNENVRRTSNFYEPNHHQRNKNEETQHQDCSTMYRPDYSDTYLRDVSEIIEQERNRCFAAINDYLDMLENSSVDEIPNRIEQNYMKNENERYDAVNMYDKTIYIEETPTLIYSYKNKDFIAESNDDFNNSIKKESPNTSTSTKSDDNFIETSNLCENNFYRDSFSFRPVIIPRLPLRYVLPTVIEILEPNRQSAKVTEISYDENVPVKRKTTNSWVTNGKESSTGGSTNKTTEINIDNSRTDSPQKRESTALLDNNSTIHNHNETREKERYASKDSECNTSDSVHSKRSRHSKEVRTNLSSKSNNSRTQLHLFINTYIDEETEQSNNKYLNSTADDSLGKNFDNSIRSKDRHLSPNSTREFLSVYRRPPSLPLSLSGDMNPTKQSWFKRFIKCMLCCK